MDWQLILPSSNGISKAEKDELVEEFVLVVTIKYNISEKISDAKCIYSSTSDSGNIYCHHE